MAEIFYSVDNIVNCGCYDLTFSDGVVQTTTTFSDTCHPVETCTCTDSFLPSSAVWTPPTAATYFLPGMLLPNGAMTVDGAVALSIVADNGGLPNGCVYDCSDTSIIAVQRSLTATGFTPNDPIVYCGGINNLPGGVTCNVSSLIDATEQIAVDVLTSCPSTFEILISGLLAATYDGYVPIMNYVLTLVSKGTPGCYRQVHLVHTIPYDLLIDAGVIDACVTPDVRVVTFELTHNSLTPIQSGTTFDIIWSGTDTLSNITVSSTNPNITIVDPSALTTTITLTADWDEIGGLNDTIDLSLAFDDTGCATYSGDVTLEVQSNTTLPVVNATINSTISIP